MSVLDHWDWIRISLAIALIGCNVGVWWGVALEEKPSTLEFGKKLLVRSLALEAFIAALLFVVDTVALIDQKSEILALTVRAGNAEQLADNATKQAITAQERLTKLAESESALEKRHSEFLDSITPPQLEYGQFWGALEGIAPLPVVIEAEPDPNSQFFARDLDAAFRQAGWPQRSIVNEPISFIQGIRVKYLYLPPQPDDGSRKSAAAVCKALNAQLLTEVGVFPAMTFEARQERESRLNLPEKYRNMQRRNDALDWPDAAPPNSVVIHIGPNPSRLFLNNARA